MSLLINKLLIYYEFASRGSSSFCGGRVANWKPSDVLSYPSSRTTAFPSICICFLLSPPAILPVHRTCHAFSCLGAFSHAAQNSDLHYFGLRSNATFTAPGERGQIPVLSLPGSVLWMILTGQCGRLPAREQENGGAPLCGACHPGPGRTIPPAVDCMAAPRHPAEGCAAPRLSAAHRVVTRARLSSVFCPSLRVQFTVSVIPGP